jgi:hypothetical protein
LGAGSGFEPTPAVYSRPMHYHLSYAVLSS